MSDPHSMESLHPAARASAAESSAANQDSADELAGSSVYSCTAAIAPPAPSPLALGEAVPGEAVKEDLEEFYDCSSVLEDSMLDCLPTAAAQENYAHEQLLDAADSLFSANSKDSLVRVLFSKKRLAMVISLKEGTFLMGLLITSLK